MTEHHVEKAFREHANLQGSHDFQIARSDNPDLGLIQNLRDGFPSIELNGGFAWCGRRFHFQCDLNTGGFEGSVIIQAFTARPVLVDSVFGACELLRMFPGYGLNLHAPTLPGRYEVGEMFWGIATRVSDQGFDERSLISICRQLSEALADWEYEESEDNAA